MSDNRHEAHQKRLRQIEEEFRMRQEQQRMAIHAQHIEQKRLDMERKKNAERNIQLLKDWREKKRHEQLRRKEQEKKILRVEENRKTLRQAMSELMYQEWLKRHKDKKLNIPRNGYQVFGPKPPLTIREEWIQDGLEDDDKNVSLNLSNLSLGEPLRTKIVPDFKSLTPWKCKNSPGSSPKSSASSSRSLQSSVETYSDLSTETLKEEEQRELISSAEEPQHQQEPALTAYQRTRLAYGLSSVPEPTVQAKTMGCKPKLLRRSDRAANTMQEVRTLFKV